MSNINPDAIVQDAAKDIADLAEHAYILGDAIMRPAEDGAPDEVVATRQGDPVGFALMCDLGLPVRERLVNLTPHAIDLLIGDRAITIPADPAGPARVAFIPDVECRPLVLPDGTEVPRCLTQLGTVVTGLPDPQPGVTFLVSRQVVEAIPDRADLAFVHRVQRDPDGQPIGAQAIARPAPRA